MTDVQTQLGNLTIVSGPIVEAEPPSLVPKSVARYKGKIVLIKHGYWASVLTFLDTITDPVEHVKAYAAVHEVRDWERSSPYLLLIAQLLGLNEHQMDDLFIEAAAIVL